MGTIKTSLVATTLIAALALTGCAQSPDLEPWAIGVPSGETTVGSTEAADATALPENAQAGDIISEELARDLNRDLKDGLRGYELPDGTWVLVKQNEPLPAAVKADVERQASELEVITAPDVDSQVAAISIAENAQSNLAFQTGKKIVLISYGTVVFPGDLSANGVRPAWMAMGSPLRADGRLPHADSAEALRAEVEALIAQQNNPAEWEIIVQPR